VRNLHADLPPQRFFYGLDLFVFELRCGGGAVGSNSTLMVGLVGRGAMVLVVWTFCGGDW